MKNQTGRCKGDLFIQIKGTMAESILNKLIYDHIPVWDITKQNETSVCFHTFPKYHSFVYRVIEGTGCEAEALFHWHWRNLFFRILKRPVLVISILLCMVLSIFLPKFVFFYEVVGITKSMTKSF